VNSILLLALTSGAFAKHFEPVSSVVKASPDAVKAAAVATAVAEGYAIESEGQFQIVFQKNMSGVGGFFANALLAPPACSSISPRWIFTLIFLPGADGVSITTHTELEHATSLCVRTRENRDRNESQHVTNFLAKVKGAAEQVQETPKPAPSPDNSGPAAISPAPVTTAQPAQAQIQPAATTAKPTAEAGTAAAAASESIQDDSLGAVARRVREKKQAQEQASPPKQ
jgi:hypothetical protein